MTNSEILMKRLERYPSDFLIKMGVNNWGQALDHIAFKPVNGADEPTLGFAAQNWKSVIQFVARTPVTRGELGSMSPKMVAEFLGEIVWSVYTTTRNELKKRLSTVHVEPAGVYEDLIDWAAKEWATKLMDGSPYTGASRGGQVKILFVHRYTLATKKLETRIEVHEAVFAGADGPPDVTVTHFTLPRNPQQSTLKPPELKGPMDQCEVGPVKLTPTVELNDDFISQFTGNLGLEDTRFVCDAIDDLQEALIAERGFWPGWNSLEIKMKVISRPNDMSPKARHLLLVLLEQAGFKARIEADPAKEGNYGEAPDLESTRMYLTVVWKQHQPSGIYADSEKQ